MRDAGHRTAEKAKIIYPPLRGVDIIILVREVNPVVSDRCACAQHIVGWTLSRDPH